MVELNYNLILRLAKTDTGLWEQKHDKLRLWINKLQIVCSPNKPNSEIVHVDKLDDKSNDLTSGQFQEPADGSVVAEFGSWRNYVATTPHLYRYFKGTVLVNHCNSLKFAFGLGKSEKATERVGSYVQSLETKTLSVCYKLEAVLKEFSTRSPQGEFRSLTLFGDLYTRILGSKLTSRSELVDYGEIMNHINQQSISLEGTHSNSFQQSKGLGYSSLDFLLKSLNSLLPSISSMKDLIKEDVISSKDFKRILKS